MPPRDPKRSKVGKPPTIGAAPKRWSVWETFGLPPPPEPEQAKVDPYSTMSRYRGLEGLVPPTVEQIAQGVMDVVGVSGFALPVSGRPYVAGQEFGAIGLPGGPIKPKIRPGQLDLLGEVAEDVVKDASGRVIAPKQTPPVARPPGPWEQNAPATPAVAPGETRVATKYREPRYPPSTPPATSTPRVAEEAIPGRALIGNKVKLASGEIATVRGFSVDTGTLRVTVDSIPGPAGIKDVPPGQYERILKPELAGRLGTPPVTQPPVASPGSPTLKLSEVLSGQADETLATYAEGQARTPADKIRAALDPDARLIANTTAAPGTPAASIKATVPPARAAAAFQVKVGKGAQNLTDRLSELQGMTPEELTEYFAGEQGFFLHGVPKLSTTGDAIEFTSKEQAESFLDDLLANEKRIEESNIGMGTPEEDVRARQSLKELKALEKRVRLAITGVGKPPAGAPAASPTEPVVKRSATFTTDGVYDVTLPDGSRHQIYRDPGHQFGYPVWYVVGHEDDVAWRGFTKAEVLSSLLKQTRK